MSTPVFYQWPPGRGCESIFPRAVLIQRICNLVNRDIEVVNVPLPKPGTDFPHELLKRLKQIPFLEIDGARYRSSMQIWDHLIKTVDETKRKLRLTRADSIYSSITQEWCNETFINSLVYARWVKEENYQRFISGVDFGPHATPESLKILRTFILRYLSRTFTGNLSPEAFKELLVRQFSALSSIIEEQTYFERFAKHPTLTDLYVHMVVQGFLSSDLEESKWIEDTYPKLIRWYSDMEVHTQKDHPTGFFTGFN